MKSLLARLTLHKAIGVYVDEHEVVVSQIAGTPFGPVELSRGRQAYGQHDLAEVIQALLQSMTGSRKRPVPTALGISHRRVFFSTRPMRPESANAPPQALLREVLQSPNVCIDEMTAEVVKGEFSKRKLASVASCRKEYLFELLQALRQCGVQPRRTEPAPMALLRLGIQRRRSRRGKPTLRVFLAAGEALAVATAGNLCVFWKAVKLPSGREAPALSAAIRSCQGMLRQCGLDVPLDVVILYGRTELRQDLAGDTAFQKTNLTAVWCDDPTFDGPAIAHGLALGCLADQPGESLDLSRSFTPRPSLAQIFPWGELAVQLAVVMCMGLFMWARAHSAQQAVVPVLAELSVHTWVGNKQQAEMQKEKQDLTVRVDAIRKFVASRIRWTNYTHDVSMRLPPGATLTAFQGICELEKSGKNKGQAKKSFLVRAVAPVSDDGSIPKEIDRFLNALRGHPLLQKDFPLVELADIKTAQALKDQPPNALFTVLCLPKAAGPARTSEQPAAKGGHK